MTSAIGEDMLLCENLNNKSNDILFVNYSFKFSLGFTINSHNIKKQIFSTSIKIMNQIKDDVKNNLISLKIDCVKRHSRSIMGVNIQFIKNNKVCLEHWL